MFTKQKIQSYLVMASLVITVAILGSCRASGGVSIGDRSHPKTVEPVSICLLMVQGIKPIA